MDQLTAAAVALVTAWTRLYTTGLAPALRDGRRAEVASDVWEQVRAESGNATGGPTPAVSLLARCILGMPADFGWRFENGALLTLQAAGAGALARSAAAGRWTIRRGLPGATTGLAALYLVIGVVMLATLPVAVDTPARERAWAGAFLCVSGVLVGAGFWAAARRPKLGLSLLVAGVVPIALSQIGNGVVVTLTVLALAACGYRAWGGWKASRA